MFSGVVSVFARAKQASFHFLTFEFYLHVLNRIVAKISVCFYNYSPHPKPPVFGSSNVCVLHDKATKCFFICTEMRMIVFLIELPNREHVFFMQVLIILI